MTEAGKSVEQALTAAVNQYPEMTVEGQKNRILVAAARFIPGAHSRREELLSQLAEMSVMNPAEGEKSSFASSFYSASDVAVARKNSIIAHQQYDRFPILAVILQARPELVKDVGPFAEDMLGKSETFEQRINALRLAKTVAEVAPEYAFMMNRGIEGMLTRDRLYSRNVLSREGAEAEQAELKTAVIELREAIKNANTAHNENVTSDLEVLSADS